MYASVLHVSTAFQVKDLSRDEVNAFPQNRPANAPVIGHYTQMVWALTTEVGCGFIEYEKDSKFYQVRNN